MSNSDNLRIAKREKNDEFYTQYSDIQKEVERYKEQFNDKIVYCNCDNLNSNFVRFFQDYFKDYNLKELHTTGTGCVYYHKTKDKEQYLPFCNPYYQDNLKLLQQADIIVTNPPFSLFRDYIALFIRCKKKFLILGSQNALSYNDIFSWIQQGILSLGYNSGSFTFEVPSSTTNTCVKDNKHYQKLGNICWYTNLQKTQMPFLQLSIEQNTFSTYDNYNAIEIPKVDKIPYDLRRPAGVPITFLQKYNPKQFNLIGKSDQLGGPITVNNKTKDKPGRFYLNGKRLYERIVIQKKDPIQSLYVTDRDIEQAVALAEKQQFLNNLRDRDYLLQKDCSVRGFLGEIIIKRYIENHDCIVTVPDYTSGSDIDMLMTDIYNRNYSIEVKTSLLPQTNLNDSDVKVFVHKKTDTPQSMRTDPYYKDIMIQVYYEVSKTQRENSDLTDYSIYKDKALLAAIIYKENWLNWLEARQKKGYPLQWSYEKRNFWYCPLYLSGTI